MELETTVERIESGAFEYFRREHHPYTGLVSDSTRKGCDASIAASGFSLASHAVAAHRGYLTRREAARRVLIALEFLDGRGTNGFHYHFLDPVTGERAGKCEVSTIDSAILFAGALAVAEYFDADDDVERRIRRLGTAIYLAADWMWASPRPPAISHGWTPEKGFLRYDWRGYNEALLLYVLALGSPSYPAPEAAYDEWLKAYRWKRIYGHEFLYGGPLFVHQTAHSFIDFRGISDAYMGSRGIDYFENSRRATYVQREYAIRNPRQFAGYGANCWGVSASTGPGREGFHGYRARGVPYGPDDGTIAPWATAASLPFAPEIVLPAVKFLDESIGSHGGHGLGGCFNRTYAIGASGEPHWTAPDSFGIDQGPVVMMLENYRSGLVWRLLRRSPYVRRGLERAGFSGGWLERAREA
ncbi:MAG: glucoamylase family protein [Gemmatimonadaceae bacterium]